MEQLPSYYVNTGSVINLDLFGTGTTRINSADDVEVEIKELEQEPKEEKLEETEDEIP